MGIIIDIELLRGKCLSSLYF